MTKRDLLYFVSDESGATATEYGIIVGVLSLAMLAAAESMGNSIGAFWSDTSTKMSAASANGGNPGP